VVEADMMQVHTLLKEIQVDLVVVMPVVHHLKEVQMQGPALKVMLVVMVVQIHHMIYLPVEVVAVQVALVLISMLELLVVMVDLVDWVDKFQQHLEILHQE
jgi:hypothetical protein